MYSDFAPERGSLTCMYIVSFQFVNLLSSFMFYLYTQMRALAIHSYLQKFLSLKWQWPEKGDQIKLCVEGILYINLNPPSNFTKEKSRILESQQFPPCLLCGSGRKRSEPLEPKSDDLSSSERAADGWTVGQAGVEWAGGVDDKLGLWACSENRSISLRTLGRPLDLRKVFALYKPSWSLYQSDRGLSACDPGICTLPVSLSCVLVAQEVQNTKPPEKPDLFLKSYVI